MKEDLNIEELFKNSFEQFEAPVDPSVWTSVQSSIAGKTAATAGKGILAVKGLKTAALIITTLGVGLGMGYLFFNEEEPVKKSEPSTENIITAEESTNENPVEAIVTEENIQPTEASAENKTTLPDKEKVKVIVKEESQIRYRSVVQQWLTPANRRNNNSTAYLEQLIEKAIPEIEKTNPNNTVSDPQAEVIIEQVAVNKPLADIKMSFNAGTAPLVVDLENSSEAYEYSWDFGDGTTSSKSKPQHVYNESGNYTVTLTIKDKEGNVSTDSKLVEVLEGMEITTETNVFSPNGDGKNDVFILQGNNIANIHIVVMNIKGQILFETNDINRGWNGEDKMGRPVPEGVYYYIYTAYSTDGKVKKGKSSLNLTR